MPLPSDRLPHEPSCGDVPLARLNVQSLSESNIEHVGQHLLDLAAKQKDLRLDLRELEYLTSSGLGLFLTLHKKVRAAGGQFSLHNVGAFPYELFTVTLLHTVLDVHQADETDDPAVAALA